MREALDWTARQIEGCGWEYLVWTGAPLTELRNVRLVAAARRPRFVPQAAVDAVVARCGSEGVEIGALERTISHMDTGFSARQAILAALWAGHTKRRTGSAKGDATRHALRDSGTTDAAAPGPAEDPAR